MKKIIICFLFVIGLTGCSNREESFSVGLIKTSSFSEDSKIILFDKDLNEINQIKCNAAELGSNFIQPSYKDNYVYFVPRGLIGKYDDKKIIRFDTRSGDIYSHKIDRINLQGVTIGEEAIYCISNFNGVSYLTQINKKDNCIINEVSSEEYIMDLVVYSSNKVCLFEYGQSTSFLKVYDKNLKLLFNKEITDIGSQHSKYAVKDNKIFFSNPYIFDNENSTLSIFNLDDYSLNTIQLNTLFPSDIIIVEDKILVAHTNDVDPNGNIISIIDSNDYSLKTYTIDVPILRMEVLMDRVYILSPNINGITNLSMYDLSNDIKKIKSIKLDLEENFYYSSLFINNTIEKS